MTAASRPKSVYPLGAKAVRILVADDHLVYRIGIRNLLGSEPGFDVVGEAADGLQAVELYRKLRPDVLLLDLRMPHKNGVEVVRAIRQEHQTARILVVTSYQTEEEVFQVLQAGAQGYVVKDVGRETLIEAIRAVNAGTRWVPPAIQKQFSDRVLRQELTAREIEVLRLLTRGLTNREIANVYGISANTVKNHLNNLMAKLDVADRTEAVSFCLARGIVKPEEI
ncbi:response regulator [Occallatibacter riparius]|uniref:Response regulator transcription factor n=1 Tax=Occallatibacter riparius TaxID=1002689 RepID=A0A9J7BVM8_9BACT|nr:response regulator transcription factor [Occallatibacter riparius]UWZ85842.1 response regulator transcription factor [Occallatibacter riparius]